MNRDWRPSRCNLAFALLAVLAPALFAQDIINSSPAPVGSGARALGMGGAFVAIADDATAASWNPGGLTQLERPEISLVYSWKWFEEDWKDTYYIHSKGDTHNVEIQDINYLSVVYPIPRTFAGRNFVVSLNYQRKLDFDRHLKFTARDIIPQVGGSVFDLLFDIDFSQEGGLGAISPAFGFEITDKLSMGLVANIWDSDVVPGNEWKTRNIFHRRLSLVGGVPLFSAGETDEDFDNFTGTNYTIGLLYKPNEHWSVGAVYHTKFTSEHDRETVRRGRFPAPFVTYEQGRVRTEWPEAIAVGAAYRFPNDKLTLSADITWRPWDDYVKIDKPKDSILPFPQRVSPITNLPLRLSPHDDTWTVRLGAEYVFVNDKKPKQDYLYSLRGGIFYDPEPASGRKDTFFGPVKGDGDPDDYYGFALGAGVLIKNRVNVDIAYQYRFGNGVKRDTFTGNVPFENGFEADVRQHLVYLSTVIYF